MVASFVIDLLKSLWVLSPRQRETIDEWERGILLRRGRIVRELGPGVVWYWDWPLFGLPIEAVESEEVNLNVAQIDRVSVVTEDDVPIEAGLTFTYRIEDIRASYLNVQDYEESVRHVVQAEFVAELASLVYEEVSDFCELQSRVLDRAREAVSDWGIKIESATVSGFTRTRHISITHTQASGMRGEEVEE